jgi:hypothetical protein
MLYVCDFWIVKIEAKQPKLILHIAVAGYRRTGRVTHRITINN